jgi:hypothetical protein
MLLAPAFGVLATAMLLKYAWTDCAVHPGQQTPAIDVGADERSMRTYLKELEGEAEQRGLGKINSYRLHVVVQKRGDSLAIASPDRQPLPGQEY